MFACAEESPSGHYHPNGQHRRNVCNSVARPSTDLFGAVVVVRPPMSLFEWHKTRVGISPHASERRTGLCVTPVARCFCAPKYGDRALKRPEWTEASTTTSLVVRALVHWARRARELFVCFAARTSPAHEGRVYAGSTCAACGLQFLSEQSTQVGRADTRMSECARELCRSC